MRFMVGGDEKDSADMARVVEACDLIQQQLETTVVLIHHTGWDTRKRGSSVLGPRPTRCSHRRTTTATSS